MQKILFTIILIHSFLSFVNANTNKYQPNSKVYYKEFVDFKNFYLYPGKAYLKSGNIISGHGYFYFPPKTRKYGASSMGPIFILNGRKIGWWETDSLKIYEVMGYPDSTGWLFKVVSGAISLYTYNLRPWKIYNVYPIIRDKLGSQKITSEDLEKAKIDTSVDLSFLRYSTLDKTIDFIQNEENQILPLDYDTLTNWLSDCPATMLYIDKRITSLFRSYLKAVLYYNLYRHSRQPFLDSLYNITRGIRNKAEISQELKILKKLFFVYNQQLPNVHYGMYLDNALIYHKDGTTKKGHVRLVYDISEKHKSDVIAGSMIANTLISFALGAMGTFASPPIIIPGHKTIIGTFALEFPMYYSFSNRPFSSLLLDGQHIRPIHTDSVRVNGFVGYPDSTQWQYLVIDGSLSAFSHAPFRYLSFYSTYKVNNQEITTKNLDDLLDHVKDHPSASKLYRYYGLIPKVIIEFNQHFFLNSQKIDSLINEHKKDNSNELLVNQIANLDSTDFTSNYYLGNYFHKIDDLKKALVYYLKALRYSHRHSEVDSPRSSKLSATDFNPAFNFNAAKKRHRKEKKIRRILKKWGQDVYY